MDIQGIVIRVPTSFESKMGGVSIFAALQNGGYLEKLQEVNSSIDAGKSLKPEDIALFAFCKDATTAAAQLLGFSSFDDLLKYSDMYGVKSLLE